MSLFEVQRDQRSEDQFLNEFDFMDFLEEEGDDWPHGHTGNFDHSPHVLRAPHSKSPYGAGGLSHLEHELHELHEIQQIINF